MEKTKTPKLRFPGFTDDWEQRKLGDIGTTYTGLSGKSSADFGHGDARFVTYMNVYSNSIADPTMVQPVEIDSKQKEVQAGDVFFTTSSETPEEVGMSSVLLEKQGHLYLNSFCFGYRPTIKFDLNYLAYMLRSEAVRKDIILLAQGISRYNISKNKMMEIEVPIPSMPEQEKIGTCFRNLDNLITLYQRKLDGIKKYKEGLLQKIFPKEGEKGSDLRFPGFSGEWKEYKLGDIYSERNEKGNDSLQFLTVSIHSGVSDKELDADDLGKTVKRSEDKSTYKHVYAGDLVFNMMRAWQGAIGVAKSEGMISPAYISAIPNDEVFPLFMDYALRRKDTIEQINNLSYGVTDFRKRLYWNSFVKVKCMLPSKEEQEKIWRFLKQIDDLISLYERKIKAMTEYKKGLLQQMFV